MKKFISLVLVLCMVITLCPVISFAASTSSITKSQLQSFIDVALQSENKSKQDLNLPNSGWCARFVAYCINNSKIVDSLGKIPSGDSAYSISPAGWIADTKSAGKLYFTSSHHYDRLKSRYNDKIISVNRNDFIPLPGDIIQFSWDGTSFSHTGIVIDFKNDQVIYIDGNSNSDGGNGTYVKKHSMNKTNGYIIGYIRFNTCGHDYDGSPYNKNGYCPDCKEWMPHTAASVDAGCYYKVKASTTAHVRNHPYHASNESIPGEYKGPIPAKTGKIQVLHAVKNGFGNIWYYIKSEKLNLEGYVLADHLEKTSSSIPATISTGGLPVPGDYTVGDLRSYIVKANLYASNCKITAISGRIISQNNGQAVSSVNKYTLPSGVDSYYTAGTSLDNGLKFGSLSAGRYYYEITAYSDSVLSNHDSGNNYAKTFVSPTFRVNERAHTHNYLLEFETAHPHKYYRKCYGCGDYAYTGDTHYTYTCVYCTGITVSFDATGGSTSIGSKTVFPGNAIGALPTPSKPNHVFDGWYTQPDGGTRYTESTVCNETSGITLYAHWIPGCTVHLDANGGRCSIDSFFVYTGNTLSSLPTPRKDKHIFEGWFSSPDGGTEFTADSICTTTGEITLYARWTPFYRIYYNGYADSQTKLHDEAIIISEPKAITGYIFKKWESSLGDTYMPGDVYEENADLTLGPDLMVWADGVLDGNPAISWSLHDGVMILSGEGKMPNFGSLPPWNNYIEDIKSVIIEDGITSIGSHAFSRAVNLESVVIADSVKNIGNYAFYECKNLTSVVLPAKLQSIGMRAFSSCFSLSSITLPSSLYNLGASAFSQCSSLTEIAIPSSVYTILESTFDLCESLKTVYLDRRLNSIASFAFADTAIEHVYFDGTESQWDNVSISSGNDKLTDASFHFSAHPGYIAIGELGNDLKWKLGKNGALSISITTMSASEKMPDFSSFSDVPWSAYKNDIREVYIEYGISNIGANAFNGMPNLTSVSLPATVTGIGENAFNQCSSLEHVYYDDSSDKFDAISISSGNDPFTSASVHYNNARGTLGGEIVWEISSSGALNVSGRGPIDDYDMLSSPLTHYGSIVTSINIQSGITRVGEYTFYGLSGAKALNLPNGITEIDDFAFAFCSGLTEVDIPYGVSIIEVYAFQRCTSLTSVILPSSISAVRIDAFSDCPSLKTVYFKGTPEQWEQVIIADDTILNATLKYHTISGKCGEQSTWTYSTSGVLSISCFGKMDDYRSASETPWYQYRNNIKALSISAGYNSDIGDYAFSGLNLTTVNITHGLTHIGKGAFSNCAALTQITLPNTLKEIGEGAFEGCDSLGNVIYKGIQPEWDEILTEDRNNELLNANISFSSLNPNLSWSLDNSGVLRISGNGYINDFDQSSAPWKHCREKIKKIIIGEGVTSIGDRAFAGLPNVEYISIANTVKYAGRYCFEGSLENCTLIIPEGLTNPEESAFACSNVKRIVLLADWDDIYKEFEQNNKLESIAILGDVSYISSGAFYQCWSLNEIHLPQSLEEIEDESFSGVSSIKDVYYSGTFDDWSNISIGDYNGFLSYPEIYPDSVMHYEVSDPCISEHYWNDGTVTVEPDCTSGGAISYECRICGETKNGELPASHTETGAGNGFAPTCTKTGKEEDICCAKCGIVLRTGKEIPATGHVYQYNSNGDGTHSISCEFGDIEIMTQRCTPSGSSPECVFCKGTIPDKEPCEHLDTIYIEIAPTCTYNGYAPHRFCEECGKRFTDVNGAIGEEIDEKEVLLGIDSSNHANTELIGAVASTCTTPGETGQLECIDCGEILSFSFPILAFGHFLNYYYGQDATCTEPGYNPYEACSVCDYSTYEEIPAKGHSFDGYFVSENIIDATYDADGSYDLVAYCTVCEGEISRESVITPKLLKDAPVAIGETGYSSLTDAYNASQDGDIITLYENYYIASGSASHESTPVFLNKEKNITLDLNGYSIFHGVVSAAITGLNITKGTVRIINGNIYTTSGYGIGLCVSDANVTLGDTAYIIGGKTGIKVSGQANLEVYGSVRAHNSEQADAILADGNSAVIKIFNGSAVVGSAYALNTEKASQLLISGGYISGDLSTPSDSSVTGGTFSTDISAHLSDDYSCVYNDVDYDVMPSENAPPRIDSFNVAISDSFATVNVTAENVPDSASVFIAAYNSDDVFKGLYMLELLNNTAETKISIDNFKKLKLFIWESDILTPLITPLVYTIE